MGNIDEKINELLEEDKKVFENILGQALQSPAWCCINDIDYDNPDIIRAKTKLFISLYKGNFRYLHR